MMRSISLSWGLAVVVAFASGAISSLLTLWIVDRAAVPAPVDPRTRFEDDTLVRRLEDLGHRIDTGFADARSAWGTLPHAREAVADAQPDAQHSAALLDRLDGLERRFEQVLLLAKSSAADQAPLMRSLPVQQGELDALDALARRDREAAKRSTMLLTPAEITARFGFPDEVGGADGGGFYWNYHHLGPTGERDGGVLFVFRDGRVVWHEISIPDR